MITDGFAAVYLAQLEAFAAEGRLPRIRALHLPPVRPIRTTEASFAPWNSRMGLSAYPMSCLTIPWRDSPTRSTSGLSGADPVAWRAATQVTADCGRPLDSLPPMLSRVTCSTAQASAPTIYRLDGADEPSAG